MRKHVVTVAVIGGLGVLLWKAWHPYIHPLFDDNARLEDAYDAKLAAARERLGGGLDAVLDGLDYDVHHVDLGVSFTRAGVSADYAEDGCAAGFDDAFALALGGKDLVEFTTTAHGSPPIAIEAKLVASDHTYQLASSQDAFPGIVMTGTVTLAGKAQDIRVQPGGELEFTHYEMQGAALFGDAGPSGYEVAGAIVGGACKEAALALIEARTPWRRPAPKVRDPVDECLTEGFHCRANADAMADADPVTAAKLYAKACDADDDDACVTAAHIHAARAEHEADPMQSRIDALMAVQMACTRRLPKSCTELGRVSMTPLVAGQHAADREQIRDALVAFARGCDLGDSGGCEELAAQRAKHDPFAGLSPKPFAVKWGQWTQHDLGQLTAWVTSDAHVPKDLHTRAFAAADVPAGVNLPAGAERVFAVFATADDILGGGACTSCASGTPGRGILAFQGMDCVCALVPDAPGRRAIHDGE